MTGRFSKLTRTAALKSITALNYARAFLDQWVFHYGVPDVILSDNGMQFRSKLFQFVCATLGIKNAFTTTYHPKTNGQVERFNRTILAGLRAFAANNPNHWINYVGPLTMAYNSTVHPSLGVAPNQLVFSRPPGSYVIRKEPTYKDGEEPLKLVHRFQDSVKELAANAGEKLLKAQLRYKKHYDRKDRYVKHAQAGDWVMLSSETPTRARPGDRPSKNKLSAEGHGPYRVMDCDSHTVEILQDDGTIETVTRNRTYEPPSHLPYNMIYDFFRSKNKRVPKPMHHLQIRRIRRSLKRK